MSRDESLYPVLSSSKAVGRRGDLCCTPKLQNRGITGDTRGASGPLVVGRVHGLSPLVLTAKMESPEEVRNPTMTTIDRKPEMTAIDNTRTGSRALSPFFIAAVGMTIALVVVAAVALLVA